MGGGGGERYVVSPDLHISRNEAGGGAVNIAFFLFSLGWSSDNISNRR